MLPGLYPESDSSVDVKAVIGRAIRQWYLFLLLPGLAGFLAWTYLRYQVPQYEVKGLILLKESPDDLALQDVIGGLSNTQKENSINLSNQIQILSSFSLIRQVTDSLHLDIVMNARGRLKDEDLYEPEKRPFQVAYAYSYGDQLYNREWEVTLSGTGYALREGEDSITQGRLGDTLELPYGRLLLTANPLATTNRESVSLRLLQPDQCARNYRSRFKVSALKGSDLLELSLIDETPARSIDFINAVITEYNRMVITEKNEVAEKTLAFVSDRLNYLSTELSEVESAAEHYILQNDIIGGTDREVQAGFDRLKQNELELLQLQLKIEGLDQLKKALLEAPGDSLRYLPYNLALENLNLSPLLARYNQLLQELERLQGAVLPNHPLLQPLKTEVAEVQKTVFDALAASRIRLERQQDDLKKASEAAWAGLRRLPGKARGLLAIERQQNIREQLYLFLLQRREETALSRATAVSQVRVLEAPMRGAMTSFDAQTVYGIALALGLLLPVGLVTLQEVLDNTLKSPEQIKKLTQIPLDRKSVV